MPETTAHTRWWPWIVALLLLAVLAWGMSRVLGAREPDVKVQEAVPTAG